MELAKGLEDRRRKAFLSAAIASNRAIALRCPESGATFVEIAGGYAFFSGVGDPANRAIEIESPADVRDEQLEELDQFFRERNARPSVFISDETSAKDLIRKLEARGYARGPTLGTWWRSLPASDFPPVPEDILIAQAGPEQLELWARTVATGFHEQRAPMDEGGIEPWEVCHFSARASAENCTAFIATRSGEFSGGGLVQIEDGVALLRTASVRFRQRRNGVQRALIAARLKAASEAGCELAFSMADRGDASERNFRRFEFQFLQEGPVMSRGS